MSGEGLNSGGHDASCPYNGFEFDTLNVFELPY